jgi:hypothetical protein
MGGVGNDDAIGQDTNPLGIGGDGDGMVGTREFHRFSPRIQLAVIAARQSVDF